MDKSILKTVVLHFGVVTWLISSFAMMPAFAQQQNDERAQFPGRRLGGGTRGECIAGSEPLVALNPTNNLGVTASDRPSLYFAVPKLDRAYQVEFLLQDADGNPIYQTTLETAKTKRFVGIHLPEKTLKVGQDYHWYFSMICNPQDSSQNVVLEGWLRQVSLENKPALKVDLDLAKFYEDAGLWSDAIASLIELRQTEPDNNNVLDQWTQILKKLELDTVLQ